MKIKVIIKEPGRYPRSVHISDTLENLQRTVGGYIETVTLASDLCVICDEEGRLKGKEHCCSLGGIDFCGTVILCGVDAENCEFCDIPYGFDTAKKLFPAMFAKEGSERNADIQG